MSLGSFWLPSKSQTCLSLGRRRALFWVPDALWWDGRWEHRPHGYVHCQHGAPSFRQRENSDWRQGKRWWPEGMGPNPLDLSYLMPQSIPTDGVPQLGSPLLSLAACFSERTLKSQTLQWEGCSRDALAAFCPWVFPESCVNAMHGSCTRVLVKGGDREGHGGESLPPTQGFCA